MDGTSKLYLALQPDEAKRSLTARCSRTFYVERFCILLEFCVRVVAELTKSD